MSDGSGTGVERGPNNDIPIATSDSQNVKGIADDRRWEMDNTYDDANAVLVDVQKLSELLERVREDEDTDLVNIVVEDEMPLAVQPATVDPEWSYVLAPKMRRSDPRYVHPIVRKDPFNGDDDE